MSNEQWKVGNQLNMIWVCLKMTCAPTVTILHIGKLGVQYTTIIIIYRYT